MRNTMIRLASLLALAGCLGLSAVGCSSEMSTETLGANLGGPIPPGYTMSMVGCPTDGGECSAIPKGGRWLGQDIHVATDYEVGAFGYAGGGNTACAALSFNFDNGPTADDPIRLVFTDVDDPTKVATTVYEPGGAMAFEYVYCPGGFQNVAHWRVTASYVGASSLLPKPPIASADLVVTAEPKILGTTGFGSEFTQGDRPCVKVVSEAFSDAAGMTLYAREVGDTESKGIVMAQTLIGDELPEWLCFDENSPVLPTGDYLLDLAVWQFVEDDIGVETDDGDQVRIASDMALSWQPLFGATEVVSDQIWDDGSGGGGSAFPTEPEVLSGSPAVEAVGVLGEGQMLCFDHYIRDLSRGPGRSPMLTGRLLVESADAGTWDVAFDLAPVEMTEVAGSLGDYGFELLCFPAPAGRFRLETFVEVEAIDRSAWAPEGTYTHPLSIITGFGETDADADFGIE